LKSIPRRNITYGIIFFILYICKRKILLSIMEQNRIFKKESIRMIFPGFLSEELNPSHNKCTHLKKRKHKICSKILMKI